MLYFDAHKVVPLNFKMFFISCLIVILDVELVFILFPMMKCLFLYFTSIGITDIHLTL